MVRRFPLSRPSVRVHRAAGFTLIELLTVVAIILVLAGLLLNVAGNANYKSSVARATAEIKAMETALESYKADNGTYPRSTTAGTGTDALNAQTASNVNSTDGLAAGKILFQALSGTPASGSTYSKRYMEFKPGQLSDGSGTTLSTTTTPGPNTLVVDPFGMAYGYSTINAYAVEQNTNVSSSGYNPTFDLWSNAGYGSGGKTYPTGVTKQSLWAKNW